LFAIAKIDAFRFLLLELPVRFKVVSLTP